MTWSTRHKHPKRNRMIRQKPRTIFVWAALATACCAITTMVVLYYQASRHESQVESISVIRNVGYCGSSSAPDQTLDFYRPKNRSYTTSVPLLVYIHGGGWRSGSKSNHLITSVYGPFFLRHGIAVASIDYRLSSNHPYPDQNNDVACALSYLTSHASNLHINTHQIIFMGDSAGGQLAAFAALNIPYKHYDYEAPVGVIDFYGVSDFSKIIDGAHPDFNARRYLGSRYNQVAVPASPITYVTKEAPRFLFIHGTADTVVPISQSKDLYNLLVNAGIDADYVAIPGAKHGFIGPELPAHGFTTITNNLNSFLYETIQE